MRSIHSTAVRAACFALGAALVTAPALAASADYFLKIEGVDGESKDEKHKGEIEILSYSWGATRHADALTDGLMVLRNSTPTAAGAGAGGMGAGKVNVQDISVMRGPRQTAATDGVKVAAGDVDGDGRADAAAAGKYGAVSGAHRDDSLSGAHTVKSPRDAASGQATGRRMHKPVKFTKPLETGSISLNMKLAGCAVGTRYPSAELSTPEGRYALQDVVIASCDAEPRGSAPMEQVTLNYTKVQVRGWDPKKKEE